jgi:hypothetical protein
MYLHTCIHTYIHIGVLAQCAALTHLDLSRNNIVAGGAGTKFAFLIYLLHQYKSTNTDAEGAGQRGLQECCRSAQRSHTSTFVAMELELKEQQCLQVYAALNY